MTRAWIARGFVAIVAAALGVLAGMVLVGFDLVPGRSSVADEAPSSEPVVADDCSDSEIVSLDVAATPEIASALRDLAERAGDLDQSLECTSIDVVAATSGTIGSAIARGRDERGDGPPPHVWIPTSSIEVELARASDEAADALATDTPSLVRSPMVIAMPEPMADLLDWPTATLGWEDLVRLSANDDVWADRDHPGWGRFRLSLVERLNGFPSIDAVTSLAAAVGALPEPGVTRSDDARFQAQAQLLLLERRVDYLGDSTAAQLDILRSADDADELLQTVSALPLTEQMVWQYNGGDERRNPPDTPLAAWYPPDAGTDADYPYVVLEGSWATADTRDAAEAFLSVLRSDDGQQRLRGSGFRDRSREATPELIEADGIDPELARPPSAPPSALITGALVESWRGLSQTGNLLGVVDVSGSMKTEVPGTNASRLQLSAEGLAAGVQLLDPASNGGLWEFSTNLDGERDYRELIPMGPLSGEVDGQTRQQAEIAAIRRLEPLADTGLYDTILASYEHLLDNYEPDKLNAVIFFTDGRNDDADGITLEQLRRRLRALVDPEREALFIGVGYGPEADFGALEAVTRITGGKLYRLERPEDIRQVFIDVQTGNVR